MALAEFYGLFPFSIHDTRRAGLICTRLFAVRDSLTAAERRAPICSEARRSGSLSRCAYLDVVVGVACPSNFPMTGRPSPAPAPMLACVCRRSWSRTPTRPARRLMARHGPLRSARGLFGFSPAITYSHMRGSPVRTAKAGAFRITYRLPVLLSGRSSRPRSKSISAQRR